MALKASNQSPFGALPEAGFVRLPVIKQVFPISDSAWWAGVRSGRYPKGVKLGPRTTAWEVNSIKKLIENMSASLEDCTSETEEAPTC
jgi:prophage regulatory protein